MIRYLLDANVVSEARLPRPEPEVLARVAASVAESALAAPIWQELVFGVARLPLGRRRLALDVFVQELSARYPVLPYTKAAAAWHGAERARLEQLGLSTSFTDGQLAAVAATENLTVVTRNVKHFRHYQGLRIENWWPEEPSDA